MESTRGTAVEELSPYFQSILECVLSANEEQQEALLPSARAKIRKRTQSSLMSDLVVHNLRANLDNIPDISFKEKYGQLQVIIRSGDSGYRLKTKQLKNRKLSFIPTQLAMEFLYQVGQLELPNMPAPLTNLILTFQWNRARTEIESVSIMCPDSINSYKWEISIPTSPISKPQIIAPELPVEKTKRVQVKNGTSKEQSKKTIRGSNGNEKRGETNQS